jgi:hypothetical protein
MDGVPSGSIRGINMRHVLGVILLFVVGSANAAIITFDDLITGETSYGFDGDGDLIDDVVFSTTDGSGFNVIGPGIEQVYIDEPGLEGTSLLNPDLRVDFLNGAANEISFGFALDSEVSAPAFFASISIFNSSDFLIGSASETGFFSPSLFPEGLVSVAFTGVASYATFDFTSEFGRYIIDDFSGTFGCTENVPIPAAVWLFGSALGGLGWMRRRKTA